MVTRNTQGLFNRSQAGLRIGPAKYQIEASRIAAFCNMIGERNPVHFDRSAAVAAGYRDIIAPASFVQVIDQEIRNGSVENGEPSVLDLIGGDYRYLLHGSEDTRFFGSIYADDILDVTHQILGFEDKKEGALEFAHVCTYIGRRGANLLAEIVRTYVHRLPVELR